MSQSPSNEELTLYTDGSTRPTNPGPSGYGLVVYTGDRVTRLEGGYLGDKGTNNLAEYGGMLAAFYWLKEQDHLPKRVTICSDSQLVLNQIQGRYTVKAPHLKPLWVKARVLWWELKKRTWLELHYVPGHSNVEGNEKADEWAAKAVLEKLPLRREIWELTRGW